MAAAAPDLRKASQELYDRLQDYLRVPDSQLPEGLVRAMDELEAAWRKADGAGQEAETSDRAGVERQACKCRRGRCLPPGAGSSPLRTGDVCTAAKKPT